MLLRKQTSSFVPGSEGYGGHQACTIACQSGALCFQESSLTQVCRLGMLLHDLKRHCKRGL
jgi:hypothetical protein